MDDSLQESPFARLLAEARADPEFVAEVVPAAPAAWWEEGAALAGSLAVTGPQHPLHHAIRFGTIPHGSKMHILVATVLWFARPAPEIVLHSSLADRSVELLLRAARRSLERIRFVGGACFVSDARRPLLALLRRCEKLHTVTASSIPPTHPEHIVGVLAEHGPPTLATLRLEFFPAYEPPGEDGAPRREAWTAPLPGSLRRLEIDSPGQHMHSGLAASIAWSCAGLLSLRLSLAAHDGYPTTDALATMLPTLRCLESLELEDALLSSRLVGAIASVPRLRKLILRSVEGDDADPGLSTALAAFGGRAASLRDLRLSNSLSRCQDLIALLDGLRGGSGPGFLGESPSLRSDFHQQRGGSAPGSLSALRLHIPAHHEFRFAEFAAALGACLEAVPVAHLVINLSVSDGASVLALASAVARGRRTLRTLTMGCITLSDERCMAQYYEALGRCELLERFTSDTVVGMRHRNNIWQYSSVSDFDPALCMVLEKLAARAPRLAVLQTGCLSKRPLWLDGADDELAARLPLSVRAAQKIARQRWRACTGRAWSVVCCGLNQAKESRLATGRRLPGTSPLYALPWGVLPHIGRFLQSHPCELLVG
jgi:hypothetical protein